MLTVDILKRLGVNVDKDISVRYFNRKAVIKIPLIPSITRIDIGKDWLYGVISPDCLYTYLDFAPTEKFDDNTVYTESLFKNKFIDDYYDIHPTDNQAKFMARYISIVLNVLKNNPNYKVDRLESIVFDKLTDYISVDSVWYIIYYFEGDYMKC